jgi:hypothetical protein
MNRIFTSFDLFPGKDDSIIIVSTGPRILSVLAGPLSACYPEEIVGHKLCKDLKSLASTRHVSGAYTADTAQKTGEEV